MNYTRKRALLACDFCRHRKRKCDGAKPRCSTCEESNADCVYKELPSDRVEFAGPGAVMERLTRIEALLEEHSMRLNDIALGTQGSFRPSRRSTLPPLNVSPQMSASSPVSVSNASQGHLDAQLEQAQFLIPYGHTTSANALLSWPRLKSLAGDYPKDYFYNIEESLPLPPRLDLLYNSPDDWPALDPVLLDTLAQNYFSVAHATYPLFSPQTFRKWHSQLYENGPEETCETAICLCVYALGCLVSPDDAPVNPELQIEKDALGLQFFQPALQIILRRTMWGFQPTMENCQALLLGASYFAHLGRPLHSWKMVHYASDKLIFLLDKHKRAGLPPDYDDCCLRIFWSCFMIECDRAAELDVPRSGIEPLADKMPLPRTLNPTENDDIICFVAETAIRRLLNRIHSSLYSPDNSEVNPLAEDAPLLNKISLNKLVALSCELNRQLEEWYDSLPERIRPPKGTDPVTGDRGKVLRIRYYAARHIIHRPFVLYVALQQTTTSATSATSASSLPLPLFPMPRVLLEKCEICINSCQAYLYNVVEMLDKRSPYLWTFSQSCMACLLVLLISDSCPQLRCLMPNWELLRAMVLPKLRRWATPGSSFEAEAKILESLGSHYAGN